MKESTGSVASIYIIIFFVVIIFGFITSIISYYKGYKINNSLTAAIEDYGGFNGESKEEIEKRLTSYGYNINRDINCPTREKAILIGIKNGNMVVNKDPETNAITGVSANDRGYRGYCVYLVDEPAYSTTEANVKYKYYSYQIITYLTLDFPIVSDILRFPISTKTDVMYSCYGLNCGD